MGMLEQIADNVQRGEDEKVSALTREAIEKEVLPKLIDVAPEVSVLLEEVSYPLAAIQDR